MKTVILTCQTEAGMNLYRINGSEKSLLVGCGKTDPSFTEGIDYLVLTGYDPDQLDYLPEIMAQNPGMQVLGSNTGTGFAGEYLQQYIPSTAVMSNRTLSLGNLDIDMFLVSNVVRSKHQNRTWRRKYTLLKMPNWQWQDSIYIRIRQTGDLFTSGMFSQKDGSRLDYFMKSLQPYVREVGRNLDNMDRLNVNTVYPSWGPSADYAQVSLEYRKTIASLQERQNLILIPYVSNFGYTEKLARHIAAGIEADGRFKAELINISNMTTDELALLAGRFSHVAGIAAGTPTIEDDAAGQMNLLLAMARKGISGHLLAAAFGDFAYRPVGASYALARMNTLGMKTIEPAFYARLAPDDKLLADAEKFGAHIADCAAGGEAIDFKLEAEAEVLPEISTGKHVVIIGNGAAGTTAAQTLRKLDKTCTIDLIDKRSYNCYNRLVISDYIAGRTSDSASDVFPAAGDLCIRPDKWYDALKINRIFGVEVTAIDRSSKTLMCSDGITRSYDDLIICTGADPVIPAFAKTKDGSELKNGIFALHDLEDVQAMNRYMADFQAANGRPLSNIAIVGGGILGLETARKLTGNESGHEPGGRNPQGRVDAGYRITIIDSADRLMHKHTDEFGGQIIRDRLEEAGVRVITGKTVTEAALPDRLVFADGSCCEADMVILCCGITNDDDLIKINRYCQVMYDKADSSVYACGDRAQFLGVNLGIWSQATAMAETAARNILGIPTDYHNVTPEISFTGFGMEFFSIGDVAALDGAGHETRTVSIPADGIYRRLYFTGSKFLGGLLFGDLDLATELISSWKKDQ